MKGKNSIVGIISFTILLLFFVFFSYKAFKKEKSLRKFPRFTIGETIEKYSTSRGGQNIRFKFRYLDEDYIGSDIYGWEAQEKGGRYIVKFSTENPSFNKIYLKKKLPEYIKAPKEGWKEVPYIPPVR